jgi:hypothetical protein
VSEFTKTCVYGGCEEVFKTLANNRKWCDKHRVEAKRASGTREAKRTRCNQSKKPKVGKRYHSLTVRFYRMVCGHEIGYRIPPKIGEHLPCSRCDKWVLYQPFPVEVKVDSCRNGHPYTEKNTGIGRGGTRRCRTCSRRSSTKSYNRKKEMQ